MSKRSKELYSLLKESNGGAYISKSGEVKGGSNSSGNYKSSGNSQTSSRRNELAALLKKQQSAQKQNAVTKAPKENITPKATTTTRKPGEINALGAGNYGADKDTRADNILKSITSGSAAGYAKAASLAAGGTGELTMGQSVQAAVKGQNYQQLEKDKKARQDNSRLKRGLNTAAHNLQDKYDESYQKATDGLGFWGKLAVDAGINMGQMGLDAVTGPFSLASMAARAGGSRAIELENQGYSEGKQQLGAITSGAIEALTEKIAGPFEKIYGKTIAGTAVNRAIKSLGNGPMGRTLLKFVANAAGEGAEEVVSDILNPIVDKFTGLNDSTWEAGAGLGQNMENLYGEDWLESWAYDALVGSVLGGLGTGGQVVGSVQNAKAAYGANADMQRALVTEGMSAEAGEKANTYAEKLNARLDAGKELNGIQLARQANMNEKGFNAYDTEQVKTAVENRLNQLGETENTAEVAQAVAKRTTGQRLSSAESKALRNSKYGQRVFNELAEQNIESGEYSSDWAQRIGTVNLNPEVYSKMLENADTTAQEKTEAEQVSEKYGEQAEQVKKIFEAGSPDTSAQAFDASFKVAYMAGQNGDNLQNIVNLPAVRALNNAQVNAAYKLGQAAADNNTAVNMKGEENNGGEVRIRRGSERNDSQSTGEQARSMAEEAGRHPEKRVSAVGRSAKDAGAASLNYSRKVSSQALGIANGTSSSNIRTIEKGSATADMKRAERRAKKFGYDVVFFADGALEVTTGGVTTKNRAMIDFDKKTIYCRVDHTQFTADQIMRHELGHELIRQGKVDLEKAKQQMVARFGEEKINEFIQQYVEAYEAEGSVYTAEQMWEEIVCDSLGEMNVFDSRFNAKDNAVMLDTTRQLAQQQSNENESRAPPAEESGQKFSFGGENAETADRLSLDNAKQMLEDNVDPEVIRQQTGWFKGMDGKWRFEIDDRDMRVETTGLLMYNPDVRRYNELLQSVYLYNNATEEDEAELQALEKSLKGVRKSPKYLGEIVKHDDLFKAYPELKDIEIASVPNTGIADAAYSPAFNEIVINSALKLKPEKLKKVLIHEMQHAVQEKEGFASGASVDYWNEKINENIQNAEQRIKELNDRLAEIDREISEDLDQKYMRGEITDDQYESTYKSRAAEYPEIKAAKKEINRLHAQIRTMKESSARELYWNTAGEVEARDAASRNELSTEERKNTRPDIDRADVVFADSNESYSIDEIVDADGKSYGIGVKLDSELLTNLSDSERIEMVKEYIKELGGQRFTAYDNNGLPVSIMIAEANKSYRNKNGKRVHVNDDLVRKYNKNPIKQEAIALIDELIVTSKFDKSKKTQHPHGWLDNNGQNEWEYWKTYVQDKEKTVWDATLNIATTTNGEKILYDIGPIKKVAEPAKSGKPTTEPNIAQANPAVNQKTSEDIDSKYLELAKNPEQNREELQKMVDEAAKKAGYTIKAYHGTGEQFTKFDKEKIGSNYGNWLRYGAGFYFTPYKKGAAQWASNGQRINGDTVMSVFLNPKKALLVDTKVPDTIANEVLAADMDGYAREFVTKNFARFADYMIDDLNYSAQQIQDVLTKAGYESILDTTGEYVVFEPEQIKSADAVTYDDKGDIIPLSERFQSNNPDIRFSQDLPSARKLQKQNEKLKQQVDYWKGQLKLTPDTVKPVAAKLIKAYDAQLKVEDIREDILNVADVYNAEAAKGKAFDWNKVKESVYPLAEYIVDNAEVQIESGEEENYKNIKRYLKTTGISFNDKSDIADYEDFRKRNFGRILIKKDGIPIDTAWKEMQEMFGTGYFPEDITHPADMMEHLSGLVEAMQPKYANPFDYNRNEAVEACAGDIMAEIMREGIRRTTPTFADKQASKLEAAKQGYNEELAKLNKDHAAELQKQKMDSLRELEDMKKAYEAQAKKAAAKMVSKRLEYFRQRRESSSAKKKYKDRITKSAKKLSDWIQKNSDKEHVPAALREPVLELVTSIDFTSKRALNGGDYTQNDRKFQKNLATLNELLKGQQNYVEDKDNAVDRIGEYLDISEENRMFLDDVVTRIAKGEKLTVNSMTEEQLRDFSKFMQNLTTAIRKANATLANAHFENIPTMAQNSMQHMDALGEAGALASNRISKFVAWQNATPYYAFKRFGYAGETLFDGLTRGWEVLANKAQEIIKFTDETYDAKEIQDWRKQVNTIELESGEKIKMTAAQIMEFSQLLNRPQAQEHIAAGGVRIANIELEKNIKDPKSVFGGAVQQTTHHHFSQRDIDNILGVLTPRQMEVSGKLQKFMASKGAEWGNEVSMARFGYEFYTEGATYYPIVTDSTGRPMADTEAQSNDMFRLLNASFTKSLTPHANNALVVGDIFDTFADHMSDVAKLNALALPMLDCIKWYNYTERENAGDSEFTRNGVKKSMEAAFGEEAGKYFRTLIKDINGVKEAGDRGKSVGSKLISNYKIAAVGANIRVALLQPTSFVRAQAILKKKHMVAALNFSKYNKAHEEAMKYSGTAVWKSLGYYDTDISRSMRQQIEHDETVKDKIAEKSMVLAEKGDQITWGRLWVACKLQTKENNPELQGEDLSKATADLFREVIYSTQVMDSTLTRTEMMRGSTIQTKLWTAFGAEPALSFNILMDAASQFNLEKRKNGKQVAWQKSKGIVSKALMTYVCSAAASALIESLWDAFRDDDDYESFLNKFWQALIGEGDGNAVKRLMSGNLGQDLTIIGKIPVFKDMFSALKGDSAQNMMYSSLSNAYNAFQIWKETRQLNTGELDKATKTTYYGNMTEWGKIYKSLQALSQLSGIAGANMTRDVAAIWNTIVVDGLGISDKKIKTYDAGTKSNVKYAVADGYMSEDDAVKALVEAGEMDEEAAKKFVGQAKYNAENGTNLSQSQVYGYTTYGEPAGISVDVYEEALAACADMHADVDENGKSISGSAKAKKLDYINGLNGLTAKQKDAMYYALGFAESTISDAPWH